LQFCVQVAALKNLGLNIRRAKLKRDEEQGVIKHKFFITDRLTADKVAGCAHPPSCLDLVWSCHGDAQHGD